MRDFAVISLFRPVIFGRFPAFALISLQVCILPAPLYRDLQGPCTDGERRKSSALPSRRPKTETFGRCASAGIALRPRSEMRPDLPELTVIHINFIRIMINALDRGQ